MPFMKPTLLSLVLFVVLIIALTLPKSGMIVNYDGTECSGQKELYGFMNPFWSIDDKHCQGKEAETVYHLESWTRLVIMLLLAYSISVGIDLLYRKAGKQ